MRQDSQMLLTPTEMALADSAAVKKGLPAVSLMAAAGFAVVEAIRRRWSKRAVLVLCGPGNNGGDGFVIARLLHIAGWPVCLAFHGDETSLSKEAMHHFKAWQGRVETFSDALFDGVELVVDAMFGAGLSRPLDARYRDMVNSMIARKLPICAVDVPSGVDGSTGEALGQVVPAVLTVTFFRKKPGHLLFPGRALCGELVVADIGIPEQVLADIKVQTWENSPELWCQHYPWPRLEGHKFHRGHAVMFGGESTTGASRLTARSALRIGAGLVTVTAPSRIWPIYAASLTSVMATSLDEGREQEAFAELLTDARLNAICIGPGAGLQDEEKTRTRHAVMSALATKRAVVLDADALSAFAGDPQTLFGAINGSCVMTPHEGEFARVFPEINNVHATDKVTRARLAAKLSGAVVLLKGADTVIASPDGQAIINSNAPAHLATGGSGDVLAGFIVGLLAQGMAPFDAAAAAVWLHGEVANVFGIGLIAEDLPECLPGVLSDFKQHYCSTEN